MSNNEAYLARTPGEDFPSIKSRLVTLIRVNGDNARFACSIEGKRHLLGENPSEALYLTVWTGRHHSDLFKVPAELFAKWVTELSP